MEFIEKVKDVLNQGLVTSKDLFGKAKERARDLGEKGVINFEIMQLRNQAEKLIGKLGSITYEILVVEEQQAVSKKTSNISEILKEIDEVKGRIEEKETELERLDS